MSALATRRPLLRCLSRLPALRRELGGFRCGLPGEAPPVDGFRRICRERPERLRAAILRRTLQSRDAVLAAGSATADKQELAFEDEAVELAERIMDRIVTEHIDGAFEMARPYSSMSYGEFNAFAEQTTETFKARPPIFGEPLGHALVERETVPSPVPGTGF